MKHFSFGLALNFGDVKSAVFDFFRSLYDKVVGLNLGQLIFAGLIAIGAVFLLCAIFCPKKKKPTETNEVDAKTPENDENCTENATENAPEPEASDAADEVSGGVIEEPDEAPSAVIEAPNVPEVTETEEGVFVGAPTAKTAYTGPVYPRRRHFAAPKTVVKVQKAPKTDPFDMKEPLSKKLLFAGTVLTCSAATFLAVKKVRRK